MIEPREVSFAKLILIEAFYLYSILFVKFFASVAIE